MNMRQLTSTLFVMILLCTTAQAKPLAGSHSGLYLGAYYGVPTLGKASATDSLGRFNLKSDPGKLVTLTLGYDLPAYSVLGEGRVELAYTQSSNSLTRAEFSDGLFPASGEIQVRSLLFNTFTVFHNRTWLLPYLGVGLGAAQVRVDQLRVSGLPVINDESVVFAGQGGCGLTMDINSRLRLDLGYRYFISAQPELRLVDGSKVTLDMKAHIGLLGLAYKF
ncbi:outer membrane protein [Geopsychrobacter electrodiphilus]|uniref:outer membrane protein n=1 Tax=Geopsychrobacter electrodiphilus TaxID=225196 RepID=UPI0003774852|nr:outer membrane beta-barrel protein [Geopsychrobacter electrodiphilus]